MDLKWAQGNGPVTTQELADEVEREGALYTGVFIDLKYPDRRCLWGVINDWCISDDKPQRKRLLELDPSYDLSNNWSLSTRLNDQFEGTPEERCAEMVRRIREIP